MIINLRYQTLKLEETGKKATVGCQNVKQKKLRAIFFTTDAGLLKQQIFSDVNISERLNLPNQGLHAGVRQKNTQPHVFGSCVATVKIAEISGLYSIQMQGRDPRSLTVVEQHFPVS